MTASPAAFGVKTDLARGQHSPLDGVDLCDEVAVARERDIPALEQDLQVCGPAFFGLAGKHLTHDLGKIAAQILGEVHADAALVDREACDGQGLEHAAKVALLLSKGGLVITAQEAADETMLEHFEQSQLRAIAGAADIKSGYQSPLGKGQLAKILGETKLDLGTGQDQFVGKIGIRFIDMAVLELLLKVLQRQRVELLDQLGLAELGHPLFGRQIRSLHGGTPAIVTEERTQPP